MPSALFAGIGLGFSLIVAIGAQNLFVLRQGLRREHVLVVAGICAVSDLALIALGVSGVGAVLHAVPWLTEVVRWVGALFLLVYALMAVRRAWRPSAQALAVRLDEGTAPEQHAESIAGGTGVTLRATRTAPRLMPVVLTCLALTWLNPHVYLDTVFLLGSIATTHGDDRWLFALGAGIASVAWFFGLALAARHLGRWLATPRAWRVLDLLIAAVMIVIAVGLVLPR